MTLRRIHNNINTFKQQNTRNSYQNRQNSQTIYYDEDQPSHPKSFVQSNVKWGNSKIKEDIGRIVKNKEHLKVSTAREGTRSNVNKYQAGKFTALSNSRNSKAQRSIPQINDSDIKQEQLFVPQRNKIKLRNANQHLRMSQMKQKMRNTSFSTYKNGNISPITSKSLNDNEEQLKFAELKLINPSKNIHQTSNLRRFENEQRQREKLLNNRLKFISIDNERQKQKVQLTKRKYERILSVRSQFLKEKQTINKKRLSNYLNEMNHKHSKVSLIKQQQNQIKVSISRLSQSKTLEASKVRQVTNMNSREIHRNKLSEIQKKKQMVRHTQSSLENSRERISQIKRSKIESIRTIENKKLIKHYLKVENRQKVNEKLYQTLQKQIKLINERKLKAASQLKEYEDVLGLNGKKSNQISLIPQTNAKIMSQTPFDIKNNSNVKNGRAMSSGFSTSGSKSFYLTNY